MFVISSNIKHIDFKRGFMVNLTRKKGILFIVVLLFFALLQVAGQNIRIATIAPENSPWGEGLKRMAREWSRISNGRVRVSFFFGGIAGSEEDSIRKMRINQLQGLALTSQGINILSDAVLTLSSPRLVRNDEELAFILDEMKGTFDDFLRSENVEVMAWSQAGWLRLFSRTEIRTPDQLRRRSLALSPSDPGINRALNEMGFRGVEVDTSGVLTSLNSGLIDAFLYSPIGAAAFQWFAVAPFMLELEISPFLGAIIIDSRTWRQVPAQFRDEMIQVAEEIGAEIGSAIRQLENQAIQTMTRFGLQRVQISDAERQQWEAVFAEGNERALGLVFNRDIYREAETLLQQRRR